MFGQLSQSALSVMLLGSLLACSGSESGGDLPNDGSLATPSRNSNEGTDSAGDDEINGSNSATVIVSNTTPAPMANLFDSTTEGLIGPLGGSGIDGEYAQFNDSPFANVSFGDGYFYLEDFEDKILEHPGAKAAEGNFVSLEFGEGFHDSVDADDGIIDGASLDGESWFVKDSSDGVVWSFDESQLNGQLPTHVGIVWTDGRDDTRFEAFDASGKSLGTIAASHDDQSFNGETIEDRFYGVVHFGGVSSIRISNDYRLTGIEVDHLQWGYLPEELR